MNYVGLENNNIALIMHAITLVSHDYTKRAQTTTIILLRLLCPKDYAQNPHIIISLSESMTYFLGLKFFEPFYRIIWLTTQLVGKIDICSFYS